MRTRVRAASAVVLLGVIGTPSGVRAADVPLGGYTAAVMAAPVTIRIYEPVIPLPASPQAEADISFTRATTSTGPSVEGTASTFWPGAGAGDGFATIAQALGLGEQSYPVVARATYPGGEHEGSNDMGFASMSARAGESGAIVTATAGTAFPVSQVLSTGQMSSSSTTALTATKLTATAEAVAGDLVLAGGVIRLQGVHATATASSTATAATSAGQSVITGVSIAGTELVVDDNGLHLAGSDNTIPGIPQPVVDGFAQLGIAVRGPQVTRAVKGAEATYSSSAMQISIDTFALRDAISSIAPYKDLYYQLVGMLPQELQDVINNPMIPSLVEMGPKIVYDIGVVSAATSGSPAFGYTPGLPDITPPPGDVLGGGDLLPPPVLGGSEPIPDVVPPLVGAPTLPVAENAPLPEFFGGMPAWLLLGGLALSALGAFGLRRMAMSAGILPGGYVSCGLGADGGVPDLREG